MVRVMAEYRHGGHTLHDIKYHLVWITKYRFPVLKGDVALRCRELIRQICQAREVSIVRGGGLGRPPALAGERAPAVGPG